ncbi:MAG TPA: nucleoside deaminase [Bacteriovoracaceae bacterium]|nr:nucleoside deaminase [Bacteriovoracaceae bacterium]
MSSHHDFLLQAVKLAQENKAKGGRPFGAVLVKDGKVVATGVNEMLEKYDASSHAELEAIRTATTQLKNVSLNGCTIYASGHPCPMCLAAILMTKIEAIYFAYDNADGEPFGFSSEQTYKALGINRESLPIKIERLDIGIPVQDVYQ